MGGKRKKKTEAVSPNTSANVTASSPGQLLKKQRQEDDVASVVLSQNPFSILSEHTATNVSNLNGFGDEIETEQEIPVVNVRVKLPPIVVKSIRLDKLSGDLRSLNIDAEFKLCRIGIKVFLRSHDDFTNTKSFLDRCNAEYFTHDIAAEKPFKAVIRGLPNMKPEYIKSELAERYKLDPLEVYPMSRKQDNHLYRDKLYLVHFKKGSVTLGALKAIRSLYNIIVSWEDYRGSRNGITQCMRCLHFGHGSRNCRIKARCNVCAQPHETRTCPLEDVASYKCANCSGNHRATDHICTKRNEYKAIRTEASSKGQPGRRPRSSPPVNQTNFPHLPGNNGLSPNQNPPQDPPVWPAPPPNQPQQRNEETSAMYSAAELLPIFGMMWKKMQQCRSRADQIICLGEFLIQYGS